MSDLLSMDLLVLGEKYVTSALLEDNFANVKIQAASDSFNYISADGVAINILVRIKTSLSIAEQMVFTDQEKAHLISNAILQNRIAYAAYVTVNSDGSLSGEINWHKLS